MECGEVGVFGEDIYSCLGFLGSLCSKFFLLVEKGHQVEFLLF